MLLQYGDGDRVNGGEPSAGGWLCRETRESLAELNELCLGMLAEQATVRGSCGSLVQVIAEVWRTLDASARRRAAGCPYLLIDAGFGDPLRWQPVPATRVDDAGDGIYAGFFTVPGVTEVARLVFTYAWHLARSQAAAARLLLAMPSCTAASIRHYTLPQIHSLAERHTQWLAPRWPARVQVWRDLLLAAASGEPLALERARLRGLTLLAAEARLAPQRAERLVAAV